MELETEHASKSESSEIHISIVIVLFVISFLILAGNLLTTVSILNFTKRKNTFSLLLLTLSLMDVLNVLGPNAIALYVFLDKDNDLNRELFTLCRVQAWTIVFLRVAATLTVTLLGMDRVFITVSPRFYCKRWKGKLFVVFFFGIWIIAAVIATWPLLWLDGYHVSKDTRETFCLFLYKNPFAGFFVLFLVCSLSVCWFCFYAIFRKSNKNSFSTKPTDEDSGSSKHQPAIIGTAGTLSGQTKELSRMAAVVVFVYFCCIVPWMVSHLISGRHINFTDIYISSEYFLFLLKNGRQFREAISTPLP